MQCPNARISGHKTIGIFYGKTTKWFYSVAISTCFLKSLSPTEAVILNAPLLEYSTCLT